ncbi:hypothetical protein VB834_15170 [Limnoraphis robusta Tam1]|uniref:C-phycocyanin alpha subunit n=1 Tax=Limnoraphis robusta CCNP1315 TaxID=3110306 RepID=A0ABU5U3D6_9CYAN|nr:hypothetical protein [Limnoraphis robusta]MEA5498341.1 hypothetical protein [Limnoraphis robusta BA-68 BA1]MEA5521629.1 hypothetical protein [Limnoraphis robusta CCNP1315]MEA5540365.1 hypothetical protein [Limnoraphis robusta Tam1]MEA5545187.1 hypothetical protein [Limnoraphis robusta CCNP1324]
METQHEDFNKIYQACLQGILAQAATNNGSLMALSQDTSLGQEMRKTLVKAAKKLAIEAVKQLEE